MTIGYTPQTGSSLRNNQNLTDYPGEPLLLGKSSLKINLKKSFCHFVIKHDNGRLTDKFTEKITDKLRQIPLYRHNPNSISIIRVCQMGKK